MRSRLSENVDVADKVVDRNVEEKVKVKTEVEKKKKKDSIVDEGGGSGVGTLRISFQQLNGSKSKQLTSARCKMAPN